MLDYLRIAFFVAALVAGIAAWLFRDYLFIDVPVAQALIGTFSVLAGFLVSAIAFINPIGKDDGTTSEPQKAAIGAELVRKSIRITAFFYLYLFNVLLLVAYLVVREAPKLPYEALGNAALAVAVASVVVSLELPRMILRLRSFQS